MEMIQQQVGERLMEQAHDGKTSQNEADRAGFMLGAADNVTRGTADAEQVVSSLVDYAAQTEQLFSNGSFLVHDPDQKLFQHLAAYGPLQVQWLCTRWCIALQLPLAVHVMVYRAAVWLVLKGADRWRICDSVRISSSYLQSAKRGIL